MASEKVINYFDSKFGEYNYKCRLQDFSDEQIRTIITELKPASWYDIEDYLIANTSDPEVLAHLKGFDSMEERRQMVARFRELISEE